MAGKVNNPIQSYQEATNQLLAINEQRKSNTAQAKMEETLIAAQNNTLAQAAEFVASGNNGLQQPVNATFNPATQNILGQYGLGQPKIQKSSSSSQQTTKQNITINNKNTTITNNNVQVPAAIGGPVQGRPIQFQDPSQIKFKTWVSNAFAQQTEQAEKRKREYEKRDSALTRSSNKLMKKLEEAGKNIASSMNPKNMASSMGNQLKTLLYLFGFAYIAKNWPKILDKVTSIENKVIEIKDKVVDFFTGEGSGLSKMLGGKENETPFQAFKNLFIGDDGILPYIRDWLSARMGERREAIKVLDKPDLSWKAGEGVQNNITRILGDVLGYLGNILSAIIDPTNAAAIKVNSVAEKSEKKYQENNQGILSEQEGVLVTKNNKDVGISTSSGDKAVVEGKYNGVTPGSVDSNGNLANSPISTISQGNALVRAIDYSKKTGELKTADIATGLSRLKNSAQENGKIVLTKKFLDSTIGDKGIEELNLQPTKNYRYIVRPKTDEEKARDVLAIAKDNENLRKALTGVGIILGSTVTTGGTAPDPVGAAVGGGLGNAIGWLVKKYKELNLPETTIELRNISENENLDTKGGEMFMSGPDWSPDNLYEVNQEQLQKIIDKIVGGNDVQVDLKNSEFMRAVEKSLITKENANKISRDINIDKTYKANEMVERNNVQLATKRENSRLNSAADNISQKAHEMKNKVQSWKADTGIANFKIVANPSNINSGDISGVLEASKKGVFYSNGSDVDRIGGSGPMSKHGHGYISLGKDLHGFMHMCTSGPATFYHDGTSNHINLNGRWWNTGSPKTATGTRIGEVGFRHVWSGTREEGYNTASIEKTGFKLVPGDIMLNFGRGKSGPSSHAQMWNGEQWVSDTYQKDRSFVYGSGRLGKESAQIWRYDAMNDTSQYANSKQSDYKTEMTGLLAADDFEDNTTNNVTPEGLNEDNIATTQDVVTTSSTPPTQSSSSSLSNNYMTSLPDVSSNEKKSEVRLKEHEVDRTIYGASIPFVNNSSNKATNVTYTKEPTTSENKTEYISSVQKATNFTDTKKEKPKTIDYTVSLSNIDSDLSLLSKISGAMAGELEDIKKGVGTLSAQVGNSKQSTTPKPVAQSFTQPNANT